MVRDISESVKDRSECIQHWVFAGVYSLLACLVRISGRGTAGDGRFRALGVCGVMIGWICYLVSRLKAAWKALEEAAERQRNYWDGGGQ